MVGWLNLISKASVGIGTSLGEVVTEHIEKSSNIIPNTVSSSFGVVGASVLKTGIKTGAQILKRANFFLDRPTTKAKPTLLDPQVLHGLQQKNTLKADNPLHTLMALQKGIHSEATVGQVYEKVHGIVDKIKKANLKNLSPQQKLQMAYKIIETTISFAETSDFVEGILEGYLDCDTQSTLVIAIAHEMNWPVHLVYAPMHAFVRWDDGKSTRFNMDLKGTIHKDEHYRNKHSISPSAEKNGVYLKSLNKEEFFGHCYFLVASVLHIKGKFQATLPFYNQAINLNSKNFFALSGRARINLISQDFDKGHADLKKAHALDPQDFTNITLSASVYYKQKEYKKVEETLLHAFPELAKISKIGESKERAELIFTKLANQLSRKGLQAYDKANELEAQKNFTASDMLFFHISGNSQMENWDINLVNKFYLGKIAGSYNNYRGAVFYFECFSKQFTADKIFGRIPENRLKSFEALQGESLFYQGSIQHDNGEHRKAVKYFEKAHAINPNILDYQASLGLAYFMIKDYPKAKLHLQKVAAKGEVTSKFLQILGDIYYATGDYGLAREAYNKILKMDPANAQAKLNLSLTSLFDIP